MTGPHILAIDSGVGGFGIARALRRAAPDSTVAFLADHAFFPYGEKDDATLVAHLLDLVPSLARAERPDAVVVACNTASTIALGPLRARLAPVPVVGCVPPVKWAASISASRTIGLLATGATVGRDYVRDLRARFAPDCRLLVHGARDLADAAERRFRGEPAPDAAVRDAIDGLFGQDGGDALDVVCLGCTHYGLLLPELADRAPRPVAWLDPADAVARHTAAVLAALPEVPAGVASGARRNHARTTRWPADAAGFRRGCASHGFAQVSLWPDDDPDPARG